MSGLLFTLAQGSGNGDGMGVLGLILGVVWLAVVVFYIFVGWKIFEKANQPGWAYIIPIYNMVVMLQIIGRPIWWIVLFFIPLVNVIVGIMCILDFAKSFGKGTGFAVGLLFLGFIFAPMLAFGDAKYQGPAAA